MAETYNWENLVKSLLSINAENGLPEDVFLAVSTLVPITNVDLLILDDNKRILLTRRSDHFFGDGWHIPGGCVRFKETMLERVQKTAINELGSDVTIEPNPIAVRDVIINTQRRSIANNNYRAHHIAVLFKCHLPEDYVPENKNLNENSPGFIKWFDKLPSNLLQVHDVYLNDIIQEMVGDQV